MGEGPHKRQHQCGQFPLKTPVRVGRSLAASHRSPYALVPAPTGPRVPGRRASASGRGIPGATRQPKGFRGRSAALATVVVVVVVVAVAVVVVAVVVVVVIVVVVGVVVVVVVVIVVLVVIVVVVVVVVVVPY